MMENEAVNRYPAYSMADQDARRLLWNQEKMISVLYIWYDCSGLGRTSSPN